MIKRYDIEDWKSLYDLAESTIKLQESAIAERDALLREAMHVLEFTVHNLSNLDITYEYTKAEHEVLGKIREVIGE